MLKKSFFQLFYPSSDSHSNGPTLTKGCPFWKVPSVSGPFLNEEGGGRGGAQNSCQDGLRRILGDELNLLFQKPMAMPT